MKSLNGFSLLLKILVFFLIFSHIPSAFLFSDNRILETSNLLYTLDDDGNTSFRYQVILSASPNYGTAISTYTIVFPFADINFNNITVDGTDLVAERSIEENTTTLTLDLEKRILNISNPIKIELAGNITETVFQDYGNTKILSLPGAFSNITTSKIEIQLPEKFGEPSNLGSNWTVQKDNGMINLIMFGNIKTLNFVWGEGINYNFEINKTLFNPPNESLKTFDVNIPKAHVNQKILFTEIEPLPSFAYQDTEGNIFFYYELKPDSEVNIFISGQIQIFPSNSDLQTLTPSEKPALTEQTGYWFLEDAYEINRIKIHLARKGIDATNVSEMDKDMRQKFYKLVYDYVLNQLEFSTIKMSSMESNIRQGADKAISSRTPASPEDYVDVLSAIYRKYGVPTKMVEGYVTMMNQNFYHSWLEFWDDELGWKAVDPSLEDFTKQDMFNVNLNNHIVILTRGYNYLRPRMMFFHNDDFYIEITDTTLNEELFVSNTVVLNQLQKTNEDVLGIITIENTGNTILQMQDFIKQDNITFTTHNALQLILPGQTINLPFAYHDNSIKDGEKVLIKYISINGEEKLHPVEFTTKNQIFWWWSPLINILKITVVAIIVYIIYIISSKTYTWIRKYYQ
jgi:hypothetical protein